MEKGELNLSLGIAGCLYDVFNRMARDCAVEEARPLFSDMGRRLESLVRQSLKGTFGKAAGRQFSLQEALDNVFEPMARMHALSEGNPVLRAVWRDAQKVFDSFEAPVVEALQKCQQVAPDKPGISVMRTIKFRYLAPVSA